MRKKYLRCLVLQRAHSLPLSTILCKSLTRWRSGWRLRCRWWHTHLHLLSVRSVGRQDMWLETAHTPRPWRKWTMLVERVLVMISTLIPTTKGGEITHTSLGKSGEIKGKVWVRTRMCTCLLTCKIKIRTCTKALSIMIRGLSKRRGDQPCKIWWWST